MAAGGPTTALCRVGEIASDIVPVLGPFLCAGAAGRVTGFVQAVTQALLVTLWLTQMF